MLTLHRHNLEPGSQEYQLKNSFFQNGDPCDLLSGMSKEFRKNITGRGASSNQTDRFSSLTYEATYEDHDEYQDEEKSLLRTQVFKDTSRTILSKNSSPDLGFEYSVNSYRGCEHGCAYCYARPTHEYLGFSPGLDFESKIMIKEEAPALLREALQKKSYIPKTIFMSGVTDCYQPLERKYRLTRGCLEVLAEFKNPVSIITKNALVTRDVDLLQEMSAWNGAFVMLSITTLDPELSRDLEPRTSHPESKLRALEALAKAGIPVGVNVAPLIPGLTDHELPNILKAAKDAGAQWAGFTALRLPHSVSSLFEEWLETHRPLRKTKFLNAIKDIRGGKMNDPNFTSRMRGEGPRAEHLRNFFDIYCRKYKLNDESLELSTDHFKRITDQMSFEF